MTNLDLLNQRLALMDEAHVQALTRFWAQPDAAKAYRTFLVRNHQLNRATVPLLEVAQRRSAELSADDPMCAMLAGYYAEHLEEERDHERWTLDDLEAAGLPRSEVLSLLPPASMASAVGAQYYWVLHHHPVALLGYLAVLEGRPSMESCFDEIAERSGLPADAFRVMRLHARLDPDHRDEIGRLLDRMPLQPAHWSAIGVSIAHTSASLARSFTELLDVPVETSPIC